MLMLRSSAIVPNIIVENDHGKKLGTPLEYDFPFDDRICNKVSFFQIATYF